MKNSTKNTTLLLSGIVTGVLIGAYYYQNSDKLEPQKKKLNKLLGEFQSIALDLKGKLLSAGEDGLAATKTAISTAKETAKEKVK